MPEFNRLDEYIDSHLDNSLDELKHLVSYPSVSAKNKCLHECAQYVADLFKKRNFKVFVHDTAGAPIITAERKGESEKTILFYNHYDVQPPEPLEFWQSPPFETSIRENRIFGRGTSDNKGNIINRLFAIDSILSEYDQLPCTVKFLIEGEEETSSTNLETFIKNHSLLLQADACIWEFGGVDHQGFPMQYLGLRGICYVQLEVKTAKTDVHSGLGGSIFPNAAWRLVWALSSIKDADENILLPGFYDKVVPPTAEDKLYMQQLPDIRQEYKRSFGLDRFLLDINDSTELRIAEVFKPTCTICGIMSGYQGPGAKTVLPSKATAKVDFRLVPNQRPKDVSKQLRVHLDEKGFSDIEIKDLGGLAPSRTDPNEPFVQLMVESAKDVYGVPMRIVPMTGGSGPNYLIQDALNIPIVTIGVGYPDSKAHSPNENIRLSDYLNTAKHLIRVLFKFGSN